MGIVFTFAQANSRILCKFFNKKAFDEELDAMEYEDLYEEEDNEQ